MGKARRRGRKFLFPSSLKHVSYQNLPRLPVSTIRLPAVPFVDAAAIERCGLLGIPLSESYGGEPVQRGEEETAAEVPIKMEPNEEE